MNIEGDKQAQEALKKNGIEFIDTTAAEKISWENLAAKALESLKEKGVYPADEYLKLQKMLLEYRNQQ